MPYYRVYYPPIRRRYFPRRRLGGRSQGVPAAIAAGAVLAVLVSHPHLLGHHGHHGHQPARGPVPHSAQVAIAFAEQQKGKPYVWGGTGPAGYDCSGLVMEAERHAGITIARTSQAQWSSLHHIPASQVRPGDLVFFVGADGTPTAPGHVAMVIGPHRVVQAYATGWNVMDSTYGLPTSLPGMQTPIGYARP